jgi:very-short-patch-repair endonuclease
VEFHPFLINSPNRKSHRNYLRNRMTPEEKLLWTSIKSKKLGVWFKRQVSIGPYFLDFYCPSYHLAIEIDGLQHNRSDSAKYDKYRTDYLSSFNIKVIRFKNSELINNLPKVLIKIKSCLIPSP